MQKKISFRRELGLLGRVVLSRGRLRFRGDRPEDKELFEAKVE